MKITWLWILCVALLAVACTPEGGCKSTITGNENTVTQACGGSGEGASADVTTPAPVVVPPVVITPVFPPSEGEL